MFGGQTNLTTKKKNIPEAMLMKYRTDTEAEAPIFGHLMQLTHWKRP